MAFESHSIPVNGRRVRYFEAGEPHRTTILLLHGGFGNALLHWQDTGIQLAEEFHIIAPDLPGFGETEPLPSMTIDNVVDWLDAFLQELGINRTVLVACSFAGLAGRMFAVKRPKRVKSLVLVNGGIIPKVGGMARFVAGLPFIGGQLFQRMAAQLSQRQELAQAIVDQQILTDEFMTVVREEKPALGRWLHLLATFDKPENITPTVPTLLLWGEEDTISPRSVGRHIHEAIPGSHLEMIANIGHLPHLEASDIFAWQLEKFVKQQDS